MEIKMLTNIISFKNLSSQLSRNEGIDYMDYNFKSYLSDAIVDNPRTSSLLSKKLQISLCDLSDTQQQELVALYIKDHDQDLEFIANCDDADQINHKIITMIFNPIEDHRIDLCNLLIDAAIKYYQSSINKEIANEQPFIYDDWSESVKSSYC